MDRKGTTICFYLLIFIAVHYYVILIDHNIITDVTKKSYNEMGIAVQSLNKQKTELAVK